MSAASDPGARSVILGRIRDLLGDRPSAAGEYAQIARQYRQAPALDRLASIALFVDRLQHYEVGVHCCAAVALANTMARTLAGRERSSLIAPPDLPRAWIPAGLRVFFDDDLTYAELDASAGVVTGCALAIASTGTIVLDHGVAQGRRALTLVPDYHLCVVYADQIVETVPEAVRRLSALGPELVTMVSGPSATADIEMTRIRGVHGPRTLDVVIVE